MIKNFLMTLRRYKVAGVLNILGLTMAFVAFYVIAAQVWYSVTYNRPLEDSDRVYMISALWDGTLGGEDEQWSESSPTPISLESFQAYPEAVAFTHFKSYASPQRIWNKKQGGDFQKLALGTYNISISGIDVFGFEIVAGDVSRMAEPNTIVISESAAEIAQVGIGDQLYYEGGQMNNNMVPEKPCTIVAIFRDFPKNTFLYDHHIFRDDHCVDGTENNNWNYSNFVKFKEGTEIDLFKKIWMDKYAAWMLQEVEKWKVEYPDEDLYTEGDEVLPVKLVRVDKMYYEGTFFDSNYETGTKSTVITLSAIALAIVIIAFINFVNFFMALVPVRMRSVNICKVFGAGQGTLRRNFLFEAIGLVVISFVLALGVIMALQGGFLTEYVTCSLALSHNLPVLAIILVLMLTLAVVSAIYPSFYITKFNASLAVRGKYAGSLSGRMMRTALAGVQFGVAIVLVIVAASFFMQYRYMINYDIGLSRENILTFTSYGLRPKGETVVEKLSQYPDVAQVTATGNPLTSPSSRWGRKYEGKDYTMNAWYVMWNMPEFFGIETVGGEGFTQQSAQRGEMLLSGRLHRDIGIPVGYEMERLKVCGVMEDFRLNSVSEEDIYVALICARKGLSTFYVRLVEGADIKAFTAYVKDLVQEFAPGSDEPDVIFFNEKVEYMYNSTRKSTIIVGLFALLAVVIALMGVFGIVMFETQYRRSEIAIRKVYGAERGQLVGLLNNWYVGLVLVSFVLAAPVAWMIVMRWLEQFANRIAMPWWIFIAALVVVLAITVALVTLRSWRAASENPAEVVRQ